jgi:potassium channel
MSLCFVLQLSQTLYLDMVSKVRLFKGCSEDFLSQIVSF